MIDSNLDSEFTKPIPGIGDKTLSGAKPMPKQPGQSGGDTKPGFTKQPDVPGVSNPDVPTVNLP